MSDLFLRVTPAQLNFAQSAFVPSLGKLNKKPPQHHSHKRMWLIVRRGKLCCERVCVFALGPLGQRPRCWVFGALPHSNNSYSAGFHITNSSSGCMSLITNSSKHNCTWACMGVMNTKIAAGDPTKTVKWPNVIYLYHYTAIITREFPFLSQITIQREIFSTDSLRSWRKLWTVSF